MGWLYGFEYWTYLLPKRVGWDCAIELTESCLPVSAKRAKQLGLIDELIESDHASFVDYVREFARSKLSLAAYLSAKKRLRLQADERRRPLNAYRTHELTQMYKNFYFPNSPYHLARSAFVRKQAACWSTLSTKLQSAIWSLSGYQIHAGGVRPDFDRRQTNAGE